MFVRHVMIFCIAASVGLTGCASHKISAQPPAPQPLWRDIPAYQAPPELPGTATAELREPAGELQLRDALALALLHSPKLAEFAWS